MDSFWRYLYNIIGVPFLYAGFSLAALANAKVRRGIEGRKNLFSNLEREMSRLPKKGPRFWIHSSSMGEFEQAKPLVKELKRKFPDGSVVVSFFSPSAFDHVQGYKEADCLCYLPFDSIRGAEQFLSVVQPDVAIVVRHDLWPNHLWQLKKHNIPAVLINCSAHPVSYYKFFSLLQFDRSVYSVFDLILTVSQEAKIFCRKYNLGKGRIEVVGDTRYDQVVARAKQAEEIVSPLRKLKGNRKCFVLGSTWPSDEEVLFEALSKLYSNGIEVWIVLVPHEPTEEHLFQIEQQLSKIGVRSNRFSKVGTNKVESSEVLIVDKVGILASLYALGEVSFVGGGFGPGVHSVLEPAALGKVVIFGPKHKNSYEAGLLKKRGVGFVVNNSDELYNLFSSFLKDQKFVDEKGKMAARFVQENLGATERIVSCLKNMVHSS